MNNTSAYKDKSTWLNIGLLMLAILVAYSKIFHAGFVNWDDQDYVFHTPDVRSVGWEQMKNWFASYYIGNYQPLPMFTYAIDHLLSGTNPLVYHVDSLLWHIANTALLYVFISRLQENKWVAFFVALLFALHPVQTESVSWIAERRTVLSAFFYLLALIRYTSYVAKPSAKGMAIVFLLGLGAMLSKGAAVALPLSLFAVDIWLQRDLKSRRVWLEKIPLMVLAFVIGIVAIRAQAEGKFLGLHNIGWFDTVLYAAYAYVQYIVHFFAPVKLSVIYPYPKEIGFIQYLYLLLAIGILSLGFIAYRKRWYVLCGGILFYTVNIAVVLQFVQFGEVLMADRYLYIPCIGLLFPAVYYLFAWLGKVSNQIMAKVTAGVLALALLVSTFVRNDIWLSDFNFYSAILKTFPDSPVAQYSIGGLYMRMGKYPEAEEHINLAVVLDPNNYNAWYNKGVLYLREGKPMEALDALNRCLAINEYPKAYFSRAMLYQGTGRPELALADIEKVLTAQPENARAYYIKADCLEHMNNLPGALENYNKAIQYDDKDPLFYIRRGLAYGKMNQAQSGLNDLNMAVGLNPNNGEALYYRGIIKYRLGQSPCDDFNGSLRHGYSQAREAIEKFCKTPAP